MKNRIMILLMVCTGTWLMAACTNELDITRSFPFTVETMPIPKAVRQGDTVEIRCTLKTEGSYAGTHYTVRYFQYDGNGELRMGRDGEPFIPNDRYMVIKGDFRLYYTSHSSGQQNMEIVFEDNHGQSRILELQFNEKREEPEDGG